MACLHLGPMWPALRWARALTTTVAVAGLLTAVVCAALIAPWTAIGGGLVAVAAGVGRLFLSDRFRGTRDVPADAIVQGLRLTEEGLVDLIRASGEPELFPWDRVTHLVDARWAWLIGVGNDEWLVLPTRVLSMELRPALVEELTARTGHTFVPLP